MASKTTRRDFLKLTMAGAAVATGLGLSGCNDEDPIIIPLGAFLHGVASGDPLSDRVIIWTRFTLDPGETAVSVSVSFEVATDADFNNILVADSMLTDADRDFTVKIDVTGLTQATTYYYRFLVGEQMSPVGMTRTLPIGNIDRVRLAVFSCSNHPAGFFHVYRQALQEGDFEAVVHLGDYIYEYGDGGYATQDAASLGRVPSPATELLTLDDYRARYAQYRGDPDLRALHAAKPWIIVWDDHEVANDAYEDGAENHQADEGEYLARRDAALQAFYEWLPIRQMDPADPLAIYRSFDFGDLVSLHMLDTRHGRRDQQVSAADPNFAALITDPNRQLLGDAQQQWLAVQMSNSSATWQVLGQQVLMGRMNLPASILLGGIDAEGNPDAAGFNAALTAYLTAAAIAAQDPTLLTPEQAALLDPTLNPAIPYNLDAWDGYQAARERVLMTAVDLGKNLVSLAGDTHNAWGTNLTLAGGQPAGVEFATPSVSSPGLEGPEAFGFDEAAASQLSAVLVQLIPDLRYQNAFARGFLFATFTPDQAQAEWVYVDTVKAATFNERADLRTHLTVAAGANQFAT